MPKLQRIDCVEAYSRFLDLYRRHNAGCLAPAHTRKKTLSDGTVIEVTVHRRTGIIPEQVKTTFHMMLRKYTDNYNYVIENVPAFVYEEGERYPSLLTNNARMGEWCDCTDRTIYNHRRHLEKLGIIQTKFRGRRSDYELWITPEILFGNSEELKTEKAAILPKNAFFDTNAKTFPHSNTNGVILEKVNVNADSVDCGYGENGYGERGETETQNPPLNAPDTCVAQREEQGAGGRSPAEKAAQSQKERDLRADALLKRVIPQLPPQLEKHFGDMLLAFWMHAWKVLWPNREFTKSQQELAILTIYWNVYNRFEDARSGQQWADFQARQIEKLDKAAKFLDHNPDAYLPDPYAVKVQGKGYFDSENIRGFAGLEAWMKRDEERRASRKFIYEQEKTRREKRAEQLLRQARKDFERLARNAQMRKEVEGKTQLQLWNYYRLIFSGLGKKYEKMFANQYLSQQARDFKPPKHFQSRRQRKMYADIAQQTIIEVEEWMTDGDWYYSEI